MSQDERMYSTDLQHINLTEFSMTGRVLDIGGGGEGIIGQLLGEKVIAIDPRVDELEEASDGPLKIIMDARELKFLDNTFDAATSFFTLMYIEKQDHLKVFEEIHRVLKDNGTFIIWDVTIPRYNKGNKDIFVVSLEIKLKDKKIKTAYGIKWDQAEQDINYYIELGEKMGFKVIERENMKQVFYIKFMKA